MTADYASLEARVAELEHQIRNILPVKIDAVSFGVSVMHAEMREQFGEQGERLDRITLQLGEHGEMLAEILRRLPAAPA
jgi:predicted nucleotidyltransferase